MGISVTQKQIAWRDNVAIGMEPVEAAREAGFQAPEKAARRNGRNAALHELARQRIEALGFSADEPLLVRLEALRATKQVRTSELVETEREAVDPITRKVSKIKEQRWVTRYTDAPDYETRMRAAETIDFLTGRLPDKEPTVAVNIGDTYQEGDNYLVLQNVYAQIAALPPEQQVAAYNRVKAAVARGDAPELLVIEG